MSRPFTRLPIRPAPLTLLLLALGAFGLASARVRLGEALPPHPWKSSGRELVVLYSHDCGDIGALWGALESAGLPIRAVNPEETPAPTPAGLMPWRGDAATEFSRSLKVSAYPAVLLVQDGRVLNAWEGDFTAGNIEELRGANQNSQSSE
ncbi:penicillin-binding protein [Deinococcus sp.]|uniref:penicillin-binding protein n=1 Tax=Deinococcus sp. TaxID=47478 RepID=UPI003C7E1C93